MKTILLSLTIWLLSVSFCLGGDKTMVLLTEEEGAVNEAPSGLYEVARVLNDGPDISIITPERNDKYTSPLKIIINFIAKAGNDIDLAKLKVECLKIIIIDLTKRVLPYTTKEGIKIDKAELPKGKHKIRVTIGDVAGGITQEIFTVELI